MKHHLQLDPWKIIETEFDPEKQRAAESLFSLGNGYMGQRANFEERYSGDSLPGNYMAGVYYPDPTKVGWWKNGYPEYYARIANVANWINLDIIIDNESLDLATSEIIEFNRTLDMQTGLLHRTFVVELKNGKQLAINTERFISMQRKEIGALKYSIEPLNFSGEFTIKIYTDTKTENESSNWGERFVTKVSKNTDSLETFTTVQVKRSNYLVCTGTTFGIFADNKELEHSAEAFEQDSKIGHKIKLHIQQNQPITIYKYAANVNSRDYQTDELQPTCKTILQKALNAGFAKLLEEHQTKWETIWQNYDIIIEGDPAAQQAIRFNVFQLMQTFTGEDPRLNVGPKGFTGEKYGATTQWDSEAYCVPLYLAVADPAISRNLLLYRYNHLEEAIKNASNLGYTNGAALFPMATVDGKEGQNEWEITFEEIHRNGAMSYAIYDYVRHTGDKTYLVTHGLEVLVAIARFWSQRATFSQEKNKYVILGVTGPNEYENNVNNNWYTNMLACWSMQYAMTAINDVKKLDSAAYEKLVNKINFRETQETVAWQKIIDNMHYPIEANSGVFLQQDGYMDKEQLFANDLDPAIRPLNQTWSWDRILRSCFIKQADVLQGLYFFREQYDLDTIKKNFDFYEPRTVHESSLSPCIHAILASRIGYLDKAYEMYMRTTRLDLDDYNAEVAEGCHITSMAGSWLTIIHGFAGMEIIDEQLHLNPIILPNWDSYKFNLVFRGHKLTVTVEKGSVTIHNHGQNKLTIYIHKQSIEIEANKAATTRES
ncbi:MAG: glycoside hydrolase family 65 protein [Gammaproteobacteria bacterium]|nr:glycoside hydrolase family 65 protein [Gammaproteobacteria bacterium]